MCKGSDEPFHQCLSRTYLKNGEFAQNRKGGKDVETARSDISSVMDKILVGLYMVKYCHVLTDEGKHCEKVGLHCDCSTYPSFRPDTASLFDFRKVKGWRAECEATHGECCNNRYSDELAKQLDSILLVDVTYGNLTLLPTSTRFVALSYVWGNVAVLKCVRGNIDKLKEPGALFREPFRSALPGTILDAMHAVEASGERYLWVDCLSIVQDSEAEEMATVLKAMARIYASAEFTIVAAEGENADSGLHRVLKDRMKSAATETVYEACDDEGSGYPWHSRWASRGWTFQETLFSRRLLIFDKAVSWVCGRHIRLEQAPIPTLENETTPVVWPSERPHLGVPMGLMSLIPRNPALGRWGMIIENYSSRDLTYEQDHDKALAGATEVMSSTFPGGLYQGLPLFFFDIAILWQPRANLERRHDEPSWSWKGWRGPVDCLSPWDPFYPGVYRKSGVSTDWMAAATIAPVAKWAFEIGDDQQSPEPMYMNGFYEYQEMRSKSACVLPPGWQRRAHPDGDYFIDSNYESTGFQYSFPLPNVAAIPSDARPPTTSIINCTAPVVTTTLGMELSFNRSPSMYQIAHEKTHIGFLTVNSYDEDVQPGDSCKLVVISRGEIRDMQRARDHLILADHFVALNSTLCHNKDSDYPESNGEDNDFYNVLWVEERNGISYRKGLGVVSQRGWDRLGAKVTTIKLG